MVADLWFAIGEHRRGALVKPGWLARHEGQGSILDAVEHVLAAMVRYMGTHACSPRELELYHVAKVAADEVKRWPQQPKRRSL